MEIIEELVKGVFPLVIYISILTSLLAVLLLALKFLFKIFSNDMNQLKQDVKIIKETLFEIKNRR